EFVDWILAGARRRRERAHLVILGDFLDLLQVRTGLPPAAPEHTAAIIAAHAPVFAHLRRFSESGGAISFVVGNHDHDIFAPEAWETLRRALPALNAESGGAPTGWFAAPEAALYAEHGHQFDP